MKLELMLILINWLQICWLQVLDSYKSLIDLLLILLCIIFLIHMTSLVKLIGCEQQKSRN